MHFYQQSILMPGHNAVSLGKRAQPQQLYRYLCLIQGGEGICNIGIRYCDTDARKAILFAGCGGGGDGVLTDVSGNAGFEFDPCCSLDLVSVFEGEMESAHKTFVPCQRGAEVVTEAWRLFQHLQQGGTDITFRGDFPLEQGKDLRRILLPVQNCHADAGGGDFKPDFALYHSGKPSLFEFLY